jgi:hypothetical protein
MMVAHRHSFGRHPFGESGEFHSEFAELAVREARARRNSNILLRLHASCGFGIDENGSPKRLERRHLGK